MATSRREFIRNLFGCGLAGCSARLLVDEAQGKSGGFWGKSFLDGVKDVEKVKHPLDDGLVHFVGGPVDGRTLPAEFYGPQLKPVVTCFDTTDKVDGLHHYDRVIVEHGRVRTNVYLHRGSSCDQIPRSLGFEGKTAWRWSFRMADPFHGTGIGERA